MFTRCSDSWAPFVLAAPRTRRPCVLSQCPRRWSYSRGEVQPDIAHRIKSATQQRKNIPLGRRGFRCIFESLRRTRSPPGTDAQAFDTSIPPPAGVARRYRLRPSPCICATRPAWLDHLSKGSFRIRIWLLDSTRCEVVFSFLFGPGCAGERFQDFRNASTLHDHPRRPS